MPERILQDPHLEVMPDHAGPFYDVLRAALVQHGMTEEEAVQALDNSWTQNHDNRIQRWEQQTADDHEEVPQRPQPGEAALPVQGQEAEKEKNKMKIKDYDDAVIVSNYIAPRPAQFTIKRIEEFEYAELWYFTQEGCSDASQHQPSQNDDTFGLAKLNDIVTLKSLASIKASKNVIHDAELSFCQLSMAKNCLIPLMAKYQWPEKVIKSFVQLFTNLEMHPYRQREHGERALLVYQARVRREWHDQCKLGTPFNIGGFNEELLQSIYREILDRAQLNSINEVSTLHIL